MQIPNKTIVPERILTLNSHKASERMKSRRVLSLVIFLSFTKHAIGKNGGFDDIEKHLLTADDYNGGVVVDDDEGGNVLSSCHK